MLGRWKSLSTHRGWRGNRGRGEIFDRKPADRSVHKESQYFYFNTSGINILAFVVWHLVSRGRENFCPSERNGLRHRGGAIRGQQFHRLNGRKGLTRGGGPSFLVARYICRSNGPTWGRPASCHANIPRKYHVSRDDRVFSFRSEQLHQPRPHVERIDGSRNTIRRFPLGSEIFLWIRSLVWRLHFSKINFWIIYLEQFV